MKLLYCKKDEPCDNRNEINRMCQSENECIGCDQSVDPEQDPTTALEILNKTGREPSDKKKKRRGRPPKQKPQPEPEPQEPEEEQVAKKKKRKYTKRSNRWGLNRGGEKPSPSPKAEKGGIIIVLDKDGVEKGAFDHAGKPVKVTRIHLED
jgi:hypothetical protein